jgi:hypothetical protein
VRASKDYLLNKSAYFALLLVDSCSGLLRDIQLSYDFGYDPKFLSQHSLLTRHFHSRGLIVAGANEQIT